MKTGILTFHDCINYGALFQTYALWKTVGKLTGTEVDVIDYKNPCISTRIQVERAMNDSSPKGIARRFLVVPFIKKKMELFEEFMAIQGMLSKETYDRWSLSRCEEKYDTVLFGSDQIWNMMLNGGDDNYFGSFSFRVRKIAYAASVGGFNLEKIIDKIRAYLQDFSALSTRESRDQLMIQKECKLTVERVLDPTFLLEKEQWLELQDRCEVPDKYILLYLISPEKESFTQAKALSKRTGLPVLYVNYSYHYKCGVKNLGAVAPGRFLYMLNNAEYVLTNSFHGTALSINLKKDFYCLLPTRKERSNIRAREILARFGLEDRIVSDSIGIEPVVTDWCNVEKRIMDERVVSLRYLMEALKINHEQTI